MPFTASDVHAHLRSVGTWVDWDAGTCDGFKAGDPQTVVKGIAVAWQSTQATLEEAQRKGCNLFITHEPTFYAHMDNDEAMLRSEPAVHKAAFLHETGMVVYRCHDVWDVFPRLGIVDAWSEFLQLGQPVARATYYNLHAVPSTTAWELAIRIGQRVAQLGNQAVEFRGKRWKMISRLAVGTGAITDARRMVELGADVVLATNDGLAYWRHGAWMEDMGLPLLVVDHMTAEIPGLRKLADYMREQFPGVPVEFVGPTCTHEILASETARESMIQMQLPSLDHLDAVALPEGYVLRPMAADQVWAYLEVMNHSNYAGQCDQRWFEQNFSNDPDYDPSFLRLIWHGDRPVAAAGAWHREIAGERWGMIHWVGVVSTERGAGLGKAITLAALHRLRERGFRRAMLTTNPWRVQAIAAYMRLGFVPWPDERAPQTLWDQVLADLAQWRRENARPGAAGAQS